MKICLTRPEWRGRITSLDLQTMLFLMQHRRSSLLQDHVAGSCQLGVHQSPHVLLYRAAFHPVSLQTALVPGIIVHWGRAWLCLSWTLKASVGVLLQPVQMPLNRTPICFFSQSSLFGILCKPDEHTLWPIVQVTNEDAKHAIFWVKVVNSSKQKGQKSVWVGHFRLMYLLCARLDLAIRVHI